MHILNFENFCIWPKIGQISFFSTILYYNLTKSPTNFIFGEYAFGGVPNFVLVFEKNRTGCFKVIRTFFFVYEPSIAQQKAELPICKKLPL